MLETERAYFSEKIDDWVKENPNKFVVVTGTEALGFFDSNEQALSVGARTCGLKPFLVRQVQKNPEEVSVPALTLGIINAHSTSPA